MNPENSAKAKPTYLLKFQKMSGLNFLVIHKILDKFDKTGLKLLKAILAQFLFNKCRGTESNCRRHALPSIGLYHHP